MDLIIIKIGGSVITDKKSSSPKVNYKNLEITANQLKKINQPYVLIHGVGSFGHPIVKRTKIDQGIKNKKQVLDFAETQYLQNKLNCIVTELLIKKGIPAFPYQASAGAVLKKGKLIKMDTDAIKGMIKLGLIPVLFGVPAYDQDQGCAILSGDQIAPYLAKKLKAKKIIEAIDVEGIYTANPKIKKEIKLIKEINKKNFKKIEKYLSGSSATDVTGGMRQKYLEIINASKNGTIVQFVLFKNIKKAIKNERIGTVIKLY